MPTFALVIWPLVALAIFAALGPQRGLVWSVVIGYLFLPDGFALNPPGLPGYEKTTAVATGAFLGILFTHAKAPKSDRAGTDNMVMMLFGLLFVLVVVGPFLTTAVNRVPIYHANTGLKGMEFWDIQTQLFPFVFTVIPWILGRRYLSDPEMHAEILRAVVAFGLVYSLLTLYEVRMSPQLNNNIYGYFPHSWIQHLRSGGFRPIVFLDHGLSVGFFLLTAVVAAVGLLRVYDKEKRAFYILASIWLIVVLSLSRNLGALALGLLFAPIALMTTVRMQMRVAVFVALVFVLNPLIRDVYIQPTLAISRMIDEGRYLSLKTRFDNEDALLARANEKPITGWGTWSRWRIYNEWGYDITISDGTWIIMLGKWGWLGFLGILGFIWLPILFLGRAARRRPMGAATTALALLLAVNLIYLIPNSTLSPIAWMAAGALAGFAQFVPAASTGPAPAPSPADAPSRSGPVYSRFAPGSHRRTAEDVRNPERSGAKARSPRA